jgi:hypothetical protein
MRKPRGLAEWHPTDFPLHKAVSEFLVVPEARQTRGAASSEYLLNFLQRAEASIVAQIAAVTIGDRHLHAGALEDGEATKVERRTDSPLVGVSCLTPEAAACVGGNFPT